MGIFELRAHLMVVPSGARANWSWVPLPPKVDTAKEVAASSSMESNGMVSEPASCMGTLSFPRIIFEKTSFVVRMVR